jgi:hypothetical protein
VACVFFPIRSVVVIVDVCQLAKKQQFASEELEDRKNVKKLD